MRLAKEIRELRTAVIRAASERGHEILQDKAMRWSERLFLSGSKFRPATEPLRAGLISNRAPVLLRLFRGHRAAEPVAQAAVFCLIYIGLCAL
jgi:hypothetical protein